MPHILFINQHYYPDFAATGQLLAELCDDLSEKGFRITVITGYPEKGTYPEYLKPLKSEEKTNLTVYRIYNHPAGNKSIINRLLHFFSFWAGSVLKAAFIQEKVDLVYVMSTPPLLNGITANIIRILRGVPYLYNVQDLYPGIAVEMGTLKNKKIIRLSEKIESYVNKHAVAIATLSEQMKTAIAGSADYSKITVLPNWSDGQLIYPKFDSALRTSQNLNDKFLVTYSGNMGMSQGLDILLDVAGKIGKVNTKVQFLFIGNGAHLPELKLIALNKHLLNVTFLPYQPKESLADSLSCADLHIISTTPNLSQYLMPSKLYGILAAGKPFLAITETHSEIAVLTKIYNCGIIAQPGQADEIGRLILELAENMDVLKKMGKLGRQLFEQHFDRKIVTSKYAELIDSAVRIRNHA